MNSMNWNVFISEPCKERAAICYFKKPYQDSNITSRRLEHLCILIAVALFSKIMKKLFRWTFPLLIQPQAIPRGQDKHKGLLHSSRCHQVVQLEVCSLVKFFPVFVKSEESPLNDLLCPLWSHVFPATEIANSYFQGAWQACVTVPRHSLPTVCQLHQLRLHSLVPMTLAPAICSSCWEKREDTISVCLIGLLWWSNYMPATHLVFSRRVVNIP